MKTKTILFFLLILSVFVNAQNLVAHYAFNSNSNDESGNLNHGIVSGAVLTNDRFGNLNSAYEFDGIDDYILVTNSTSLDIFNSNLTVTMWLYNDNPSLSDTSYKGISKGGWNTGAGYELLYSNYWNDGTLHFTTGSSGNNVFSFNNYNNQWIMLTGTYDNATSTKKIYINGIEQSSTIQGVDDLSSSANDLYIGRRHPLNSYSGFVKGKIDDIRIYNVALTASEILNLYNFNTLNLIDITPPEVSSFYVFNKKVYFKDDYNLSELKSVEVYNILGQTVFQTSIIENQISLDMLKNQVYILKVIFQNGNYQSLKFINY
jgi:hypothetical protein